ncbi:hypothetical protein [Labilibaculum filiforme]|nr:hypothetical protein [Labilibaculum filiforme]
MKNYSQQYCTSNETPLQLVAGDTLVVACDTMFLINKIRYEFYKKIHQATLENNSNSCTSLLLAFENRLKDHEASYSQILANSKRSEQISLDIIANTKKSLENTQQSLLANQHSLDEAMVKLERANELIRKEKWNATGQKALTGIAGIGVGILIGVLVTN